MTPEVSKIVHGTSIATATIAVILSPIPLADEIVFVPVYVVLTSKIGRTHGLEFGEIPWKPILRTVFTALAARAIANIAVAYIPGVAAAANAVTAAALTEYFGLYVDTTCADPTRATTPTVKEIVEDLKKQIADRVTKKSVVAAPAAMPPPPA